MPSDDDIVWTATVSQFKAEMVRRRNAVTRSLNALSNKDGAYAREHRKMIRLYADVLDVVDKHFKPTN